MVSWSKSSLLSLIVVAFLLCNIGPPRIHAQEGKPVDAQTDKEQREELEKKTFALLNETASAAWSLKLPENRFFILSNTAELLWPFDEKRARTLFWDALNSINLATPTIRSTSEKSSKAEREKSLQAYFSVYNLRQRLLRKVARRDAQLALDMLRATRQVPPQQLGFQLKFHDDRQLEQEIAIEVAARDPAQALQLARQSLAKGLTIDVLNLLRRLNEKDSERASQFAADIIGKLETTNFATDSRATIVALNLLRTSRRPDVNATASLRSAGMPKVLALTDDQRRDLVELLTSAALSVSANSNLLNRISYIMPEIQEFFPERRSALERKLATFNQTLTKQWRDQNTYNALVSSGTPEEIIRTVATADAQTRMSMYRQAAIIAVAQGRTDAFRDLVSKEISDGGERRQVLDALDAEEINAVAGRKQLDELRELLPKLRSKEERARAMAELALMMKEKGEDAEAATLLDEAATLVKTDLNDERRTNALLTLLCAYAIIDPPKAFGLAEQTVDRANSQISLLMLVDRVIKTGAVKKSEIILEQPGIMPLDFLVFKYGRGVAALAKADFSRTRALADRFERNELRLMAQLMIVKGLLQPQTPATSDNSVENQKGLASQQTSPAAQP